MDVEQATDRELLEAAREARPGEADRYLDVLYRRFYPSVAHWCLRFCGDREGAADLAQEVFLRIHSRIDSFRMESKFSTWLYTVTRSVAINRGLATRRREDGLAQLAKAAASTAPARTAASVAVREETRAEVREAMRSELGSVEAKVLYLHYVDGMTLSAISKLLGLENKSGAKAFVVSGMRKLRRKFLASDRRAAESA